MKKNKSYSRTCQRSDKPDELVMIALKNKAFGERFIEEFKKVRGDKA